MSSFVHVPAYEGSLGFSGKSIGIMSGLFVTASVLVPPVWGYVMDRIADPRIVLRIMLTGSTLLFLPCIFMDSFAVYFVFRFASACFMAGLIPINDSQLLAYGAKYHLRYGPIRVWGTYGFIVGQLILVTLFLWAESLRWLFLLWVLSNMSMLAVTCKLEALPSGLKRGELLKGVRLLLDRSFATFTAGCVLHRIAMTGYYTFFSIYLIDLGLPFSFAALAWCIGPVSEILVIHYGDRLVRRLGVKSLLILALSGGIVRLLILSSTPPTWVILGSQILHALTFGAMHIASIMYVNHQIPHSMRASGQAAFNAVVIGLAGAVGNLIAGILYDAYGAPGMLLRLAGVAVVGWLFVVIFLRPVKIDAA